MTQSLPDFDPATDLQLERRIQAPASALFRCWTEPALLMRWFVPRPNRVTACRIDLRPGGAFDTTFDVAGQVIDNRGVWLEVVPDRRLVFTDSYSAGWKPAAEPFMTALIAFDPLSQGESLYRAVVRHRNAQAAKQHADMGFDQGWGAAAAQMEEVARTL